MEEDGKKRGATRCDAAQQEYFHHRVFNVLCCVFSSTFNDPRKWWFRCFYMLRSKRERGRMMCRGNRCFSEPLIRWASLSSQTKETKNINNWRMTRRRAEEFKHTKTANHDFFSSRLGCLRNARSSARAKKTREERKSITFLIRLFLLLFHWAQAILRAIWKKCDLMNETRH